ncbi:MAG: TerB family tellurite resistance protein [Proteobacteria bacterium]|nr:TerB family tellurite resistance protein [Pseudomonadota bacterium]
MSVWGKVIGGVAGFALGGPLGLLMGALAGHALDQMRAEAAERTGRIGEAERQAAFATAVIVLAAKMAKADGVVSRVEVDAFKRLFHVPASELAAVARLFDEAKREAEGFEPYAAQVAALFAHEPAVREELLDCLFAIAEADGPPNQAELAFLHRVAAILGLSQRAFRRARAGHAAGEPDPYAVLGVSRRASDDEVRAAWRKLVRENHPDKLIAQGMPAEFVEVANRKMAAINAAHDRIREERGL